MKLVRLDTNEEVKMYAVEAPKSDDGLWFTEEVTINTFPGEIYLCNHLRPILFQMG